MNGRSVLVVVALAFAGIILQQRGPIIRYLKIERM